MGRQGCRFYWTLATILFARNIALAGPASDFRFKQDTLAFANSTVFGYAQGKIVSSSNPANKEKAQRYTRRCFVMSRTVLQFHKFARFDSNAAPLNDEQLAQRIRAVTSREPWHEPLPAGQRIVFPGYRNLREMSRKREIVVQRNIGLGWPTYCRVGNFRMVFLLDHGYQETTHQAVERAMARNDFFVAFLSDFPTLHINHSVLVYAHKAKRARDGTDRYLVYDPNHPDGPRELKWLPAKREFDFQKDEEFVGGFTRVFQVYGKPFQ